MLVSGKVDENFLEGVHACDTVDGSFEIRRAPVEVGSLSHYLQRFIHPGWLGMGFLNHQQYGI